ncbi:MAG: hypothetical protein ABI910_16880 [Gemmatimonadota bacterium]
MRTSSTPPARTTTSYNSLRPFGTLAFMLAVATQLACGRTESARSTDSAATPAASNVASGALAAPHGGMPIEVEGVAQLEFNVDTTHGLVLVHVLDGAAKEPVRFTQGRIDLTMLDLVEGVTEVNTVLAATSNPKTNESFDKTSVFLGFVPQLVGRGNFKARVQRIEVGGQVFTDIPLTYPPAGLP